VRAKTERAINAKPWEPLPGMVKLQCQECSYWFAAPHRGVERCPDCEIREQRRAARAAALAAADNTDEGSQPCRQQFCAG
jgi:hypothetical protein